MHSSRLNLSLPSAVSALAGAVSKFLPHAADREPRRRPPKLHPTSYLDGLRGLASMAVFAYHYTDYNHKSFLPHYGSNPDELGSSVLQLPYIRLLYCGTPMVHVFFVISGFALAYRPLQLLYEDASTPDASPQAAAIARCHAALASAAFRRPFRLLVPPAFVTFLTTIIIHMNLLPAYMQPEKTFSRALSAWVSDVFYKLTWPWSWDDGATKSKYNPHLWTIPIELTHSLLLFLVVLLLAPLRTARARQAGFLVFMAYTLASGHWASFEFLAGAYLAERTCWRRFGDREGPGDSLFSVRLLPTTYTDRVPRLSCIQGYGFPSGAVFFFVKNGLRLGILAAAGFVLSWPPRKQDMTPMYTWLESLVPQFMTGGKSEKADSICLAVAAFSIVWACGRIRWTKVVLTSRFAQYAGRISFCFYLAQHSILNLLQHRVLGAEGKPAKDHQPAEPGWGVRGLTGNHSPTQRTICWALGLVIIGMVVVLVADLLTRIIDGPAVRFAKILESIAYKREESGERERSKNES